MFVGEEVQERNVANGLVNVAHCNFFGNPGPKKTPQKVLLHVILSSISNNNSLTNLPRTIPAQALWKGIMSDKP